MDVLYPPGMTSIAAGDLPGPYLQNCREGAKAWEARNPNQLFSAVPSRFCSAESIFFSFILRNFDRESAGSIRQDSSDSASPRISAPNSYWRFMGSSSRKDCYRRQARRTVRCMQILQSHYLQDFTLS